MAFNGLTDAQAERFDILSEEANEVGVAVSKIKRHGLMSYDPTASVFSTNQEDLRDEFEQLLGTYMALIDNGDALPFSMERAKLAWQEKQKWCHHQVGTKEGKAKAPKLDNHPYLNSHFDHAAKHAARHDVKLRRYNPDGLITADYDAMRLNVETDQNDVIVKVVGFG